MLSAVSTSPRHYSAKYKRKYTTNKTGSAYYAVKQGRKPGIYPDWFVWMMPTPLTDRNSCLKQVDGFSGAKFKKFTKLEDAQEFIADSAPPKQPIDFLHVYTDGACSGNGKESAIAGCGVWFGPDDPRNLSESLPGEKQTNQRAELQAAVRALEVCSEDVPIIIYSDSRYLVTGMNVWVKNWGPEKEVANRDLFDHLVKLRNARSAQTQFEYVEAHSGIEGNEGADQLAVAACKK